MPFHIITHVLFNAISFCHAPGKAALAVRECIARHKDVYDRIVPQFRHSFHGVCR